MRGLSQSEGLYPSDWILIYLLKALSQSLDWQGVARLVKPQVCLLQNMRRFRCHLGQMTKKSRLFGRLFVCMVRTLDCGQFLFQVFDLGAAGHEASDIFALKLGLGA